MSERPRRRLCYGFDIDRRKVSTNCFAVCNRRRYGRDDARPEFRHVPSCRNRVVRQQC